MKKKLLSLVLALVMVISLVPTSFAAAGLENFKKTNTYTPGMFRDVLSSDWYATNVIAAYQFGLVKGTTATNFNPKGNITVAETIALACRLHSIYNTGAANFTQGNPWYQVYVDYALSKGIIKNAYSNYNAKISRADFAFILNNSLPAEALKGINNIAANTLSDVANDNRAGAIYNLYRAGILTGNDKYGTFSPGSNIQRSEVATIVTRMADPTQRKTFTLEKKPVVPTSVTLAGKTTISVGETTQWKATVSPAGANQWVSWNSGNPGVATVDANGNIKGIKEGQSNITATASNGVKKTVLVTVASIKPESVTLTGKTVLEEGETTNWQATIYPAGANQGVSWTSSNPGVATVDANGNIKGIKAGQTAITATAVNGVKKTIIIIVERLKPESIMILGYIGVSVGETTQWKATIYPAGADQGVSWTSADPGIATVDANGNIKGIKAGQTAITATAINGVTKTVVISVQGSNNATTYPGLSLPDYNAVTGSRLIAKGYLQNGDVYYRYKKDGTAWIDYVDYLLANGWKETNRDVDNNGGTSYFGYAKGNERVIIAVVYDLEEIWISPY